MDQKDIVDEREENIKELTTMMTRVNDISKQMNQLIETMDQDLDKINNKQDNILKNAEVTNKEMKETDQINKKKLKKVFIWVLALIGLGACIIGLVYIIKGSTDKTETKLVGAIFSRDEYAERKTLGSHPERHHYKEYHHGTHHHGKHHHKKHHNKKHHHKNHHHKKHHHGKHHHKNHHHKKHHHKKHHHKKHHHKKHHHKKHHNKNHHYKKHHHKKQLDDSLNDSIDFENNNEFMKINMNNQETYYNNKQKKIPSERMIPIPDKTFASSI